MAYLVNRTNGVLLATVLDGQTNNTSSSIILIGKQVTNYGEIQNENFVRLLENFSNDSDPANPLSGQLWWNTTENSMQVFDGATWRPVTGFTSNTIEPLAPYVGDQWWDVTNQQLKSFNGTVWLTVGPSYSVLDGITGAIVENIYDTSLNRHTVTKMYNNGVVTSIISKDAVFTPNVAISGFTTVSPGMTMSNIGKVTGTATNSDNLDNLSSGQFLRSDVDTTATGNVSFQSTVNIGATNNLSITDSEILTTGISVKTNLSNALSIDANGYVSITLPPITNLHSANRLFVDTKIEALRTDVFGYIASNVVTINGSISNIQSQVTGAQNDIISLNTLKAPLNSPSFTGVPSTSTAPYGTNNSQIASTSFVQNAISIFDPTKIYSTNSQVKVNLNDIAIIAGNNTVASYTVNGMNTITQPANNNTTLAATTAYVDRGDKNFVLNSARYQPTVYVSPLVPNNSQGIDGDLWYQYI